MLWTVGFFVRELATNNIVHHEITEVDTTKVLPAAHSAQTSKRVRELMAEYPFTKYEVFVQRFSSLETLYRIFPEVAP